MLAALLGALSLFAAASASAQDTTIWSETLTVGEIATSQVGCSTAGSDPAVRCSLTSVLTDDDFTYGGVDYEIVRILAVSGILSIEFNKAIPANLIATMTLHVGSREFPFANADQLLGNTRLNWSNTGLDWSVGDMVELKLVGTPPPPTVSLSASSDRVTEGQSVTVTAKLSRALSEEQTIQVRVTRDTAEPGDVGTPTSITINPGAISGTGTITTKQDTDYEDETFTVSLGRLPSSVTAGSPSSVPVKIIDRGRILDWSSTLTVKQHDQGLRGCDSSDGMTSSCSEALTEDILTYNGVDYRIMRLGSQVHIRRGSYQITLWFNKRVPEEMIQALCLWIDSSRLCLRDALNQNAPIFTGPSPVDGLYAFMWRPKPISFGGTTVQLGLSDQGSGTDDGSSTTSDNMPTNPSTINGGGTPTVEPSGPPPVGGSGGGGGGLPPSGSSDEPPPEDEEPSGPDQPDACGENDRGNLERFYETTGGEQWDENENWNSEEPLNQWYGVDTDDEGEVVSLRLSENSLSGDTPEELLSCLSQLKELALWGNEEDLSGEVPEELVLAVERAVLRDIAEMLGLNPEWFENYGDPYNFEDWHAGVTTDEKGRVVELVLPGEVPGTLISQLRKLRVITISSENGGCALSPKDDSSAFSLFLLALLVFAALGRTRARG